MPSLAPITTESGTGRYYRDRALAYSKATLGVDMSKIYDRFLGYLPKPARILDAGSGSGRDTLAFKKLGYDVDAFDASPELCALSIERTGVPTRLLRFQEFDSEPLYDGVWACASLLHVPARELSEVFRRLIRGLKPRGAFYSSFKYGLEERYSEDGRFFLDMDSARLHALISCISNASISEIWFSHGEGCRNGQETWINSIVVKRSGANQNRA